MRMIFVVVENVAPLDCSDIAKTVLSKCPHFSAFSCGGIKKIDCANAVTTGPVHDPDTMSVLFIHGFVEPVII